MTSVSGKSIAVLHNAAKPGIDANGPDYGHIADDVNLGATRPN
jgi:hypothetical protein